MKHTLGLCILFFGILILPVGASQRVGGASPVFLSPVNRQPVLSPDGKWDLAVWGEKDEVQWLMLESRSLKVRYRVQVWPVNNAVYVLWRSDSKVFAFTDARFEDKYFLYVDHVRGYLQSEVSDLTPSVRSHLLRFLGKQYEVLRWHLKPLVWVKNGTLLVGVDCVTTRRANPTPQHQSAQDWLRGYLVDVGHNAVVGDFTAEETKIRFGVGLTNEQW